MTTFTKITAETVETIGALDLREEAAEAIERGEVVWYRRSGGYNEEATQVAVFDNDRVGVCYGGGAVWGDSCVDIDADGNATAWKARLDDLGSLGEGVWVDGDGRECCCYVGCEGHSSTEWIDSEGDRCCSLHWAQDYDYVQIVAGEPDVLSDETIANAYVAAMGERGWSVEVRGLRRSEAEGTYCRQSDGTLQILGYSVPVPEDFRADSQRVIDSLI